MVIKMTDFLLSLTPLLQTLLATLFTWGVTALGALSVFFIKKTDKNVLHVLLGCAAGVMLAASYFSLLAPAAQSALKYPTPAWIPLTVGFILGGVFLFFSDKLMERNQKIPDPTLKRTRLLIFSVTLHNLPEGMAIGVAFGAAASNQSVIAACMLALGIGLQNFPEGAAVALPLRASGASGKRAFFIGQLSGAVEPIAGLLGTLLVILTEPLMPYLLSFAAGAMVYVVVGELIPESQSNKNKGLMALFTLLGFSIMMLLDVALG